MADIEKFVYYDNGSKKVLKPTDRIVVGSGGLAFEGATSDDFETALAVTDPTADRTITFPDEDGDVALLQSDTLPKALSFPVKNPSTTTALTKGQVVYILGHSGNNPEVSLARANSSSTMPAFGLVTADIAAEAEGYVTCFGLLKGLDTSSGYSLGDTVYVSADTAGALTTTPPASSNLIQNIGKVTRIDASAGSILVGGAGRTNATPNLDQGKIFIGNASNQSSSSVYTLPITDGTANQVLTTDGSGAVTFQNIALDNIADGDSETTLATTAGKIIIEAKGQDEDIEFKGNDGGSSIRALALDMSAGGTAYFSNDIRLQSDSSILSFGADNDVYFQHDHNDGIYLKMNSAAQSTNDPTFTITAELQNEATSGPRLNINKTYTAQNDIVSTIYSSGGGDTFSIIETKALGITAADEYGHMDFRVESGGSNTTSALKIEGRSSNTTPRVKILDTYYLPTADGSSGNILKTDGAGSVTFTDDIVLPSMDPNVTGSILVQNSTNSPTGGDVLYWKSLDNTVGTTGSLEPSIVGLPYDPGSSYTGIKLLQVTHSGTVSKSYVDYTDAVMAELSIPGLDLQTDTNAFRFNVPYGMSVTGLDLYLDQHTTSGDVTVTVTNTTDSLSMISLSITGTNTSATTTTVTNASVDSGDIITFAITATPANAQGLRANLHFIRT
jgi:hypothetical protein